MASSSTTTTIMATISTTEAPAQPVMSALMTEPVVQPAPAPAPAPKTKLHGRAFYESIGSPKHIVAPMVDQSEFAWRMLASTFLPEADRRKILAYTPMFHARLFVESQRYRDTHFQAARPAPSPSANNSSCSSDNQSIPAPLVPWLDGNPALDRPLIVQFCANEPHHLLEAAKLVAPHCDAVDLNLGCPQGIARKGHYGAFLQEDQELIHNLIKTLHENVSVPVTAKIRVLETKEKTLAYAQNVLSAGASILTIHGRLREQKGHLTGLADWEHIRYVRDNLPQETVLFANGNILRREDVEKCLRVTGADGVMSAEGQLSDPAIFASVPEKGQEGREYWRGKNGRRGGWRVDAVVRRYLDVLHRYVYEREPPARRELFIVGDDTAWLTERRDEEEGQPMRKKVKKEKGGENQNGGGGGGVGQERKKKEDMTLGSPNLVAVQGHLFHLLRHFVSKHTDVRDALARAKAGDIERLEKILDMVERKVAEGLIEYAKTGDAGGMDETATAQAEAEEEQEEEDDDYYDPESSEKAVRVCKRPWWVVQPIIRPVPKEAMAKGAIKPKRERGTPRLNKQNKGEAVVELTENGNGKEGDDDVARTEVVEGKVDGRVALERKTAYPESELVSG
ncbi:putative dihydrouridine synthase family protein [Coniochaeta sp. 2T2.1]|nr:putative dihydrouridine synthase family protein [Coniochaeta sp. 2T2.1]